MFAGPFFGITTTFRQHFFLARARWGEGKKYHIVEKEVREFFRKVEVNSQGSLGQKVSTTSERAPRNHVKFITYMFCLQCLDEEDDR